MINWRPVPMVLLVLTLVAAGAAVSFAQDKNAKGPLSRGTPRATLAGYLKAADRGDYGEAARYLDLRNLPERAEQLGGPELAKQLAIILQRAGWVDVYNHSDKPEGMKDDGLPTYRDVLTRIEKDGVKEVLLLQLVPFGDGTSIWKISNATVARIPELYSQYGYNDYIEALAKVVPHVYFLGIELFKWIIVLAVALLAFLVVFFTAWYGARLVTSPDSPNYDRIVWFLTRPATVFVVLLILRWTMNYLGLGASGRKLLETGTITTITFLWVILSVIDLLRDYYADWLSARGRGSAVMLLKPMNGAVKMVVIVLALLVWLDNVGVDITALIAGLGIGGIAFALALQKPLEDTLAAVTLFTQQPIRVGDVCRFGDQVGRIEYIGLRNTKIRTFANSLVSVPNAKFSQEYIENISDRQKTWYSPTIRLKYNTSKECVEKVLSGISKLLKTHDKVYPEPARVRFAGFEIHALKLKISAYIRTTDYDDYLETAEELNLQIIEIVKAAGASFATYFGKIPSDSVTKDNE